jgi:hypothetical protein
MTLAGLKGIDFYVSVLQGDGDMPSTMTDRTVLEKAKLVKTFYNPMATPEERKLLVPTTNAEERTMLPEDLAIQQRYAAKIRRHLDDLVTARLRQLFVDWQTKVPPSLKEKEYIPGRVIIERPWLVAGAPYERISELAAALNQGKDKRSPSRTSVGQIVSQINFSKMAEFRADFEKKNLSPDRASCVAVQGSGNKRKR